MPTLCGLGTFRTSRREFGQSIAAGLGTLIPAAAVRADSQLSTAQERTARELYELFVAPCCWRECITVHNSPASDKLRQEIDALVAAGKNSAEVKASVVREYGSRILRVPEGATGVFVYAVPTLAATGAACALTLRLLRLARQGKRRDPDGAANFFEELPS